MFLQTSLITPSIGTIFWTTIIFVTFLLILGKVAWKPVMQMLKDRDDSIKNSLDAAAKAREEMAKLQADNAEILRQAREEREAILKEARDIKEKTISDAKLMASSEAEKIIAKARTDIEQEKNKAMSEIYTQVATLSVEIASKILEDKLSDNAAQQQLVDKYLSSIKIN